MVIGLSLCLRFYSQYISDAALYIKPIYLYISHLSSVGHFLPGIFDPPCLPSPLAALGGGRIGHLAQRKTALQSRQHPQAPQAPSRSDTGPGDPTRSPDHPAPAAAVQIDGTPPHSHSAAPWRSLSIPPPNNQPTVPIASGNGLATLWKGYPPRYPARYLNRYPVQYPSGYIIGYLSHPKTDI